MFKLWSIAVVLLMAMVACEKPNNGNNNGGGNEPKLTIVEKEWKLVSVNDEEPEFTVYLYLESGIFNINQQI